MDAARRAVLETVATATLTTVLLKHGITRSWMAGPVPLAAGQRRAVGPAFTMRFIPGREDVAGAAQLAGGQTTRAAIETMAAGAFVVVEAPQAANISVFAGVAGDILAARMQARGVVGLITDGRLRDVAGVRQTGLNVWCCGAAAPPSYAGLTFVGWQQPIGCGGVAVFPDDIIVADDDGGVVIPAALAETVAKEAAAQEDLETWIMSEVQSGAALTGLYPPNAETRARYERERRASGNSSGPGPETIREKQDDGRN